MRRVNGAHSQLSDQNSPAEVNEMKQQDPTLKHILVADLGGGTFDVCIVRRWVEWDEIHMLLDLTIPPAERFWHMSFCSLVRCSTANRLYQGPTEALPCQSLINPLAKWPSLETPE